MNHPPSSPARRPAAQAAAASLALAIGAGTLTGMAATAAADQAQAVETTVTVQSGEGWWALAQRTGVSMYELQAYNGMTPATQLHPGMVLDTTGTVAAGTVTVQIGEGWWSISQRAGMTMTALQAANGMTADTPLYPGMVLSAGGAAGATEPAPAPVVAEPAPAPVVAEPTPVVTDPVVRQADTTEVAIAFMLAKVNDPATFYLWGGNGPLGYDCSGLVKAAMAEAGVTVPRVSHDQYLAAPTRVPLSEIQRGDLVFWANQSTGRVYHVAMYLGDGQVAHALNPDAGLVVTTIDVMASNRLSTAGRY